METTRFSRRELLKGGALVVSFSILSPLSKAFGQATAHIDPYGNPDYLDPRQLDSWVAIRDDGSVIVSTGKVDLGTGIETALAQIAADELDVPFNRLHMQMGDTARTVDQGRTAGSNTIQAAGQHLRQATAAARVEMLKMASTRLDVPIERLTVDRRCDQRHEQSVEERVVRGARRRTHVQHHDSGHGSAGRTAGRAGRSSRRSTPDYRIVGTSVKRVDLPAKLTRPYTYIADVKVPGMLHGRVIRPATTISKPLRVDESSIANIKGIVKVVQEGTFVGVVAQTEWAAIQAAKNLKVTWSTPSAPLPATREDGRHLPDEHEELHGQRPDAEGQHRRRVRAGEQDIRSDVSLAVPEPRDDAAVVRGRGLTKATRSPSGPARKARSPRAIAYRTCSVWRSAT